MVEQNQRNKRVLVVDDEEGIRSGLSMLLEMYEFEVECASNGLLALQAIKEAPVDLVITDILMPDGDGLTLIKEIKSNEENVKIIAITGGGDSKNIGFLETAHDLGADATLEKPISSLELLEAINNLLN